MRAYPLYIFTLMFTTTALADHGDNIQEVVVADRQLDIGQFNIRPGDVAFNADAAGLLRAAPGANVNSNGSITGVAQYRGLFGNRVNVHLDHAPALTGGPNAMDTPLSYTPTLLLKELTVNRGIASVSAAQETLGGHIHAQLNRGEFANGDAFTFTGALQNRFNSNSDGESYALNAVAANNRHKLAALASHDDGNAAESGAGDTIAGTQYRRSRYDLSYAWTDQKSVVEIYAGQLDTRDTGTASLPMDINYVESELSGVNFSTQTETALISGHIAYSHVDHGMDNFSQRQPPMPPMFRAADVSAQGLSWDLQGQWQFGEDRLSVGVDGNQSRHDMTLANPNNVAFAIHNFNDVERDVTGIFAQWNSRAGAWDTELGVRYNRISVDGDSVSAAGLPGMMGMNAGLLATRLNQSDRSRDYNTLDLVVKLQRPLNSTTDLLIELGRKNRAPSYQELYLWLPLPVTGGLADGRSYIGNVELNEETSHELVAGLDWQSGNLQIAPQLFYRRIDDYIQGVPAMDMTANMVSTMMTGMPSLMFDNVDAELYGADLAYHYRLSDALSLQGSLSYTRGIRTDRDDDLYRIAPLNHRLTLAYQTDKLALSVTSVLVAEQMQVADFNGEQQTAGYGLVHAAASYQLLDNLTLQLGINNLSDKQYADHLAGYNRIAGGDLAVGERMQGAGRNIYAGFTLNW